MRIYRGEFMWMRHAINQHITFVFPTDFTLGQPVFAFWEWDVDSEGEQKSIVQYKGKIDNVKEDGSGFTCFADSEHFYKFDITFDGSPPQSWLRTIMINKNGSKSDLFIATLHYTSSPSSAIPASRVYIGRVNWSATLYESAKNELIAAVVPFDFATGADICFYWQWTLNTADPLSSHPSGQFQGTLEVQTESAQVDKKTFKIKHDYYTGQGTLDESTDSITITLGEEWPGNDSSPVVMPLAYKFTQ